jgi:hypothetical protein
MTAVPADEGTTLDAQWRQRVSEVGKRNFENEEMLRLGFLTPEAVTRAQAGESTLAEYSAVLKELANVRRQLMAADTQIAGLKDIEHLLGEIRARRIERVKAERVERRAAKEADRAARTVESRRRRLEEPTYLGRRVSGRLRFTGGDPARTASLGLPALETFLDVAGAMNQTPERLQWLVFERGADPTDHYSRFEIPKRSGGTRLISSPKPALRAAQEWVRTQILVRRPVSPAATAFRPGQSIVDNARPHIGAGVIVRIDVKDFFPSITFERVRGYFESLGYNGGVSSVLALVTTDAPRARVTLDGETSFVIVGERALPQGACTSPDLANLIVLGLDARLMGLAAKLGWTFTRYADDFILSHPDQDANAAALISMVTRIANDEGFRINTKKTRIMRRPNRQTVTGLLVGEDVRLTRADLRRMRAFLHRCETQGIENVSTEIGKDARAVAKGYYAYVHMVMPAAAQAMRARHSWI